MSMLPEFVRRLADPSQVLNIWHVLKAVPGGGRLMGELVGRMAPYTGTIGGEVLELSAGHARVRIRDRRSVRNHLNSVHAVALMNLGEMTTGIAMLAGLPPNTRGIVKHLQMDYLKKARGPITGRCDVEVPSTNETAELDVKGELVDEAGEIVATVLAKWKIGPSSS